MSPSSPSGLVFANAGGGTRPSWCPVPCSCSGTCGQTAWASEGPLGGVVLGPSAPPLALGWGTGSVAVPWTFLGESRPRSQLCWHQAPWGSPRSLANCCKRTSDGCVFQRRVLFASEEYKLFKN